MANAKYTEDIIDRYSEDNYERINALFSVRDFDKEWHELARVESAAVAAHKDGRFFEDRSVFLRGAKVKFTVVCASNKQPVSVTFTRTGKSPEVLMANAKGYYELKATDEDGRLQLQCGHYTKIYMLSFIEQPKLEKLPDVWQALQKLISNPANWTNDGFERLRTELTGCLDQPSIPREFAFGVKEFYFGLFHEGIKEPNYRKRLETAFQTLKPFCPYSNYATLICTYFLFRVNSFERVAALTEIPTLSRIARFFETPFKHCAENVAQSVSKEASSSTEILVSNRDFELIRATNCFLDKNFKDCVKHINLCRKASVASLDPQGDDRLTLLEARLARTSEKLAEARRLYGSLQNCLSDVIRVEAEEFLNYKPVTI